MTASRQPSVQQCESCGTRLDERKTVSACPKCGGLLELVHRERRDGAALRELFARRRGVVSGVERSGVWRYRELVVPTATDADIVSHPEGNTPLIARER